MIKSVVTYVNFYFPMYKTQFYPDNFIKACLVYQFLYEKYFTQKIRHRSNYLQTNRSKKLPKVRFKYYYQSFNIQSRFQSFLETV